MDKRFNIRSKVFEDLKSKGFVVKTALKYGFDYRVYEKGERPGKRHAKPGQRWTIRHSPSRRSHWVGSDFIH